MDISTKDTPQLSAWRRFVAIAQEMLLWLGGGLFLFAAVGHQLGYSSSKAFVPLTIAAVLLLPPSRAIISRFVVLATPRTVMSILLAGGLGFAMMVQDLPVQTDPVAEQSAALERTMEANCKNDLKCWGDKHSIKASFACRPYVERLGKYQFEWTDGWLEPKFSLFNWKNKGEAQITYFGDKIKFQNGFGAWQFATYACDYDPIADVVLNVDATPGRLPQ